MKFFFSGQGFIVFCTVNGKWDSNLTDLVWQGDLVRPGDLVLPEDLALSCNPSYLGQCIEMA
jgi:hypothetical protein